jgi:RNA 3'-terminal phosphate cyclase (ATP)
VKLRFIDMSLEIDGSHGEGGGQILRGAVSLSCITGKDVKIFNIRSRRPKPGLQPQHLISIEAAASVSGAEVAGVEVGSTEVIFKPKAIRSGRYSFDIKTAGSVTLVVQTLLPILIFGGGPSEVAIVGGTDVPWSPPVDYVRHVMLPSLRAFGIEASLDLKKRGYYPKGGGSVVLRVKNVDTIAPIKAVERGQVQAVRGISHCSNLPKHVASRQSESAMSVLREGGFKDLRIAEEAGQTAGGGPGSGIVLWADTGSEIVLGADSIGAREKTAEDVGREAAAKLMVELHTGMALDRHLGDVAIAYIGMANGTSELGVSSLTLHAESMVWLSEIFLGVKYGVMRAGRGASILKVDGAGIRRSSL